MSINLGGGYGGLFGLLVLAADLYALFSIFSSSETVGKKVVWTLLVLFLPVLGFIIWWLAGPRARAG
ncbi:PLDc_N domain-containing protein [Stagnimonas aquatica]|uniref:PLDc_N domain-containing protein n=1 Tax=Stagnimonas aquatica TaxID=2689987 RepID=A0A3N0VEZ2_9GAMM|nr:PLD nuclease N-terminal domain-containing protein [Stagnimonas aquatica]ROH90868.1 PLDc_N domain-containing protein [Stagnimonas aquatica]